MLSGTFAKTVDPIQAPSGALIEPGTDCVVMGIEREALPPILRLETLENERFEIEEFFCFADNLREVA